MKRHSSPIRHLAITHSGCTALAAIAFLAKLEQTWSRLDRPWTINLTPPGIEGRWEAEAPSRAVVLLMPPAFLSRVVVEHYGIDIKNVEIAKQFLIRDPTIEA